MLKFNKEAESKKLSDHFGIDAEAFEKAGDLWIETQKEINKRMSEAMTPNSKGFEFDATVGMEIFFKNFNTEELQKIALVQLLMSDLNERAEKAMRSQVLEQLKKGMIRRAEDTSDEEGNYEDIL